MNALNRICRASDGCFFLGGLKSDGTRLKDIPALCDVPIQYESEEKLVRFMEAEIQERTVEFWIKAFISVDLGCHRVDCLEDIRATYLHEVNAGASVDQWDYGRSISVVRMLDYPIGDPVDTPAPMYAHFKNAAIRLGTPMPKLGSDTRTILLELGYSHQQIDEWVSKGIVKEKLDENYLPS